MTIKGLQKLTLLDYPGKVACTLFTGGCNFRCPFCQNSSLVLKAQDVKSIPDEEIFSFLQKRRGLLDGVCITGGEPTLQPGLLEFIEKVKRLKYFIKLDTNGYEPEKLREAIESGFVDYIAMDIKSSPEGYSTATGLSNIDFSKILSSVEQIRTSGIEHEFRTTVVKQLHSEEDFKAIGRWLKGEERYYLQQFVDSDEVLTLGMSAESEEKMRLYLDIVRQFIPNAELRGIF